MERIPFGRTGHRSTRVLFGAAALGAMRQEKADQVLETLIEFGVNHIDTAASYGAAEDRLQGWLQDHRAKVFLATKTGERDGGAARAELERSLERDGAALVVPAHGDAAFDEIVVDLCTRCRDSVCS